MIRPSRRPTTTAQLMRHGINTPQTVAALAVLGLFACGSLMVMQDDSWWHLRCGELIWRTGTVPDRDPFSFTLPAEAHWPNHEWLAQVLFFGLYSLGGLPLLNLLGGVVMALTGAFLLAAMRGPMERRFALLMLALPWMISSLSVRPQIFTLLGLALTLHCLARRRYWPLPLVFLVWANLHGAVSIGGAVLVVAAIVQAAIGPLRSIPILIATALSGAATLVTPMGFELLLFPLESVARLRVLGLTEWMPPGISQWQDLYFWLLLAGFLGIAALRGSRVRRVSTAQTIAAAGLLAILSAMSARNIPLFLMAAAVATSRMFPIHADVRSDRPARKNLAVAGVFTGATFGALALAFVMPLKRLDWEPLRREAIAAIRETPGPMFNTYNTGGYLLWFVPERPVFVDSRQDPYPIDFLVELTKAQRTGDPGTLFDRFRLRSALLERHWPLVKTLRDLGWSTRYADDRWVILSAEPDGRRLAATR